MANQHRQRHVLAEQQKPIARHELHVVRWQNARPMAFVLNLRARLVEVAIAEETSAQAKIDILEVGKEIFIEAAGSLQEAAAVQRSAGAGREDLAGRAEIAC